MYLEMLLQRFQGLNITNTVVMIQKMRKKRTLIRFQIETISRMVLTKVKKSQYNIIEM